MKAFFSSITRLLLDARSAGVLLALCAGWLLATAGLRPLTLPDEGRYVGIAWEMLNSGNWLVPTLDGLPFFHKPPLFYWLTTLGLHIFGANEWAGRIASASAAILAATAVFAFVRKYADRQTANLTLAVLVTQPFFFIGAQFANLDMLVASMISVTIVAGADAILSLERGLPYRVPLAACYVFAALGVLAKGLIGFILPGAVLLAWLIVRKKYRLIPSLFPVPLLILFFALAAPWFLWMEKSFDGFWDYFFVYHHFRRFAETGFNNQQAFWFYFPVLLLFTIPWSPWIFRIGFGGFLKDSEKFAVRSLMILWTLGILAFFSLPKSKLVGYILPALPAFAALIADIIMQWLRSGKRANAPIWMGLNLACAAILCLALVLGLSRVDSSRLQNFASMVGQAFPENGQIVMLDEYQYDLPFYLKAKKTPWVVSDWTNPEIPKIDNWRKELYDAGQFNPKKMSEALISVDEFSVRLCSHPDTAFWIWANKDKAARYPFLNENKAIFSNGQESIWLVDKQARQQLRLCGEKPNNG